MISAVEQGHALSSQVRSPALSPCFDRHTIVRFSILLLIPKNDKIFPTLAKEWAA
jgi:hypothetical protein